MLSLEQRRLVAEVIESLEKEDEYWTADVVDDPEDAMIRYGQGYFGDKVDKLLTVLNET